MDCKRAEQLLPLHAGGDLEDVRERARLAAHLGDCDACRRASEEWAANMSLLHLHEPPEFDAAFFDPIRRDVMREIEATTRPATPALTTLLAQLLRPKPLAYAASLALVCAALLFALRLSRAPQPSKLVGDGVAAGLNKRLSFRNEKSKPTPPHVIAQEGARGKMRASEFQTRRDRRATTATADSRESASVTTPRGDDDASSSPSRAHVASQTIAPPTAVDGASPELLATNVELAVVKDEREMLKIDLQTRDPDVRIIWFSPQPNEQTSPRRPGDKR